MLCSQCSKNPALILAKAISHNKITEVPLCQQCAQAQGFDIEPGAAPFSTAAIPRRRRALRCDACGTRYADFKSSGLLGCPDCYSAFRVPIAEVLNRLHGACAHRGKEYAPKIAALKTNKSLARRAKKDADGVRQRLKEAIAQERFEEASQLKGLLAQLEAAS